MIRTAPTNPSPTDAAMKGRVARAYWDNRGSTMPLGDGTFCVGITKAIRAAAGVAIGDQVAVTVERDEGERTVEVPPDLDDALRLNPVAAQRFAGMSHTHQREYAAWVAEAKRPETRRRRIDQAVAMIAEGKPRS